MISMKMVEVSKEDTWIRKCIIRFLERISYDEDYIKVVKNVKDNETKYKLFNQLKIIRNVNSKK